MALFGIEHLNDGILITDHNNKIIFINRSFEKITGYTEGELLGRNPKILKSGLHDQKFYKHMWDSLNQRNSWEGEVLNRKKNGQLYYEWLKIIVIKDENHKITNFIAILSDITKEKELEKDIITTSQIQQQLLPQNISNPYFKTVTYFRPKRYVSGDFYDYIWAEDKKKLYGILIDFKGHGMSSALLTSAIRVLFRRVIQEDSSIEKKVSKINQMSLKFFNQETFAGVFCFEFDFEQNTLSYVAAGINYFLLLNRDKNELIEVPGMFLGMLEDEEFEKQTVRIHKGDIFCFMTDGVSDRIPNNIKWERKGLKQMYKQLVHVLSESPIKDDTTFFGVEVLHEVEGERISEDFVFNKVEEFHLLKDKIVNALKMANVNDYEIVWMALIEGINNAWLHGNKCNESKNICVSIKKIRNKRLVFRIKDEGSGYKGNDKIKKFSGVIEEEFEKRLFDESGRGLLIMMKVFDYVKYNQFGNELFLVKNINVEGDGI